MEENRFSMTHWQIMSALVNQLKLKSTSGTVYTLDDDECLLWKDNKNTKWNAVAGDCWASLFEDEIFYKEDQQGL